MTGLVRRCQYITKTDECTIRVEYGSCDDIQRQGICFTGMNKNVFILSLNKFEELLKKTFKICIINYHTYVYSA